MKFIYKATVAVLMISSGLSAKANTTSKETAATTDSGDDNNHGTIVYTHYDTQAQFDGGNKALNLFIKTNMRYPYEAMVTGIDGTVFTKFTIEEDGTLSGFEIYRGINPLLDEEAMRLIKSMPKWKPAKIKGKATACKMVLPIRFEIKDLDFEDE